MGFLPSRENTAEPYSPSGLRVLCQGEGTRQTLGPSVGPGWTVPRSFTSEPAGGERFAANSTFIPKRQQVCRHASAGGIEND